MITWDDYYRVEMERRERSKKRCEKAASIVIFLFVFVNIVCFIGASL